MSEWKEKRLEELVDINPETLSVKKCKGKIEYIDIASVSMGNLSNYTTYDITVAPSRARRIIKNNDIIFSTVRPNLKSYYFVKCPPKNAICSTGFAVLRVKNGVNSRFIYSLVTENSFIDYLSSVAKGSAYPAVDTKDFKKAKVCIPDLPTQNRIADIFSAYDDLIENNNKRIKILEQMAENLYKEWFVRFRFPGYENAEFENGIPKGWSIKLLSEISDIIMGQSPKSEYYNSNKQGLPFHQGVGSYGELYLIDDVYSTQGNRIAEPNSIIFSVRAPVGRININLTKVILGRGLASINSKSNNNHFLLWQLKYMFKKENVIGNGSIFTSVTKDELLKQKVIVPKKEILEKYNHLASLCEMQIRKLYLSNQNLIKQRDLLLPRLMSGILEVK